MYLDSLRGCPSYNNNTDINSFTNAQFRSFGVSVQSRQAAPARLIVIVEACKTCRACVVEDRDADASVSSTPRCPLPPNGQRALPSREALQGKLGYENHPTYDYLARNQARSWS
jgi:hypothetical protein